MKKLTLIAAVCVALAGCSRNPDADSSGTISTSESGSARSMTETNLPALPPSHSLPAPNPATPAPATPGTAADRSDLKSDLQSNPPAQERKAEADLGLTQPDNTGLNQRDRDGVNPTPADQGTSESDMNITQSIRKSIVVEEGDDEHSLLAKNIKIVTINGAVTLRGVVASEQEKMDIEKRAKDTPGVLSVDNQLEVKQ